MTTGRLLWLALCLWLVALAGCGAAPERSGSAEFAPFDNPATFVARPYLQLGETPAPDRLTLMWHAAPGSVQRWKLQLGVDGQWGDVTPIARRSVPVEQIVAHDIYSAELTDLAPGCPFFYRLLRDDVPCSRPRRGRHDRPVWRVGSS